MFKSPLRCIFGRKPKVVDSWEYSGSLYVREFKKHLDVIAGALSLERGKVYNLFNCNEKCAELRDENYNVLARVRVHGETGTPYVALVTPFSLSEKKRMLFALILPIRVEFQEVKAAEKIAA